MVVDEANRFRAARACRRCHTKRIKCDAIECGIPCSKCRQIDSNDCVLMQSKRGTYVRTKSKKSRQKALSTTRPTPTTSENQFELPASTDPETAVQSPGHPSLQNLESTNSGALQSPSAGNEEEERQGPRQAPEFSSLQPLSSPATSAPYVRDHSRFTASLDPRSPQSARQEVSWTTMFDKFFDSFSQDRQSQDRQSVVDKCSITYLGESFPLAMVLGGMNEGGRPALHHPGPPISETSVALEPSDQRYPSHMQPEDITYLEAKRAFTFPPSDVLDALVTTFLDQVYPIYPIVSRQEFTRQYEADEVPPMLLNAVCSMAATFCDISLIHKAGFDTRKDARLAYYSKAKVLFETGYETNKIVQLQSAILMTFWGGGPVNHWNYFSWTGTAVTIAESLGIHRSMANANIKAGDRSLLKRMWWNLVIRDAHCQSLVGRPFRVNQEQVDIEELTMSDFFEDMGTPEFRSHPLRETYGLYQIHMSRLCLILKEIVNTRFKSGRPSCWRDDLFRKLQNWRFELPPELQWVDGESNLEIFSLSLCSSYNHHLILLYQEQGTLSNREAISDGTDTLINQPIPAPETVAHNTSCLLYSIFTKSNPLCLPHETFQGIFLAEAVFFTEMKSQNPQTALVGRAALTSCQMLWQTVLEIWDASPWILRLFDHLIELLCTSSGTKQPEQLQNMTDDSAMGLTGPDMELTDEPWMMLPTLSPFLDMTQDGSALSSWVQFPHFLGEMDLQDPTQGVV